MIKNTLGLSPGLFKVQYVLMTCMFVILFAIPIPFILRIFGVEFLPHPRPLLGLPMWSYWIFGAVLAAPISGYLLIVAKVCFSISETKIGFMLFFSALLFASMVGVSLNLFFGATIPMLHTTIFGEEGHIEYEMRDNYDSYGYYSFCAGGVAVRTQVVRHSILCDTPLKGIRYHSLRKGAPITVYGRVSRAGVFYTSFDTPLELKFEAPSTTGESSTGH